MRRILNNVRNHKNWLWYYLRKYFGNKSGDMTYKLRTGRHVRVPFLLQHVYKECFFDEVYIKGLPRSVRRSSFATVVDVGANAGYFSLWMLNKYPDAHVLAFEPMPSNFNLLTRYQQEGGYAFFSTHQSAVTSTQNPITLNHNREDEYTTTASTTVSKRAPDQIQVPSTTLEAIMREHELDTIDFLKLDCEGSEYEILYGAPASVLQSISVIGAEAHHLDAEKKNAAALCGFLLKNEFRVNRQRSKIWAWR